MPDMDGFETAALIRQRERLRHMPIIFLSAIDTSRSDVFRGAASGAVDYLFKPVVPEVLKIKGRGFCRPISYERAAKAASQSGRVRNGSVSLWKACRTMRCL